MDNNGEIFYADEYGQIYKSAWETNSAGQVDISTVVYQPFVWGRANQGFVQDGKLFRLGIITEQRLLLRLVDAIWVIEAQGSEQRIDYFQASFVCERGPVDNFKHRLDCHLGDEDGHVVVDGPAWSDPDNPGDYVWGDPDSPSVLDMSWIDVWS